MFENLKSKISDRLETSNLSSGLQIFLASTTLLLSAIGLIGFIWDDEPNLFDVVEQTNQVTQSLGVSTVTGSTTVATLMHLSETLVGKTGGYLTNDIMPPGVWMDNIPNWEFGALVQIRDMARIMRNSFSRSQSQSTEDQSLVSAENQFYFDSDSWMLPETESEYRKGYKALTEYLVRLGDSNLQSAQFYARSDNLRAWLSEVETRLGSLSQRLSASVGKKQLDTSLAGDAAAVKSTNTRKETEIHTPWTELDDVFYEARGTTWALIHLLKAVEVDFRDVLEKKNASVSMQQIIRELEPTQDALWSPVILNGSGLGMVANHSLVMGSHISRANAAIIDLRRLLQEG
ncbi:MAG: DUF2333 family protein [Pseudomonadales bacterium]|nr:DUF2333 family protein [Pseudomonadales bacterium]